MNQFVLITFSPGDLKLRIKNCKSIFLYGSKFESCRVTIFCHMGIETKPSIRESVCIEKENEAIDRIPYIYGSFLFFFFNRFGDFYFFLFKFLFAAFYLLILVPF